MTNSTIPESAIHSPLKRRAIYDAIHNELAEHVLGQLRRVAPETIDTPCEVVETVLLSPSTPESTAP
jgi:hypothetical protein